MLSYITALTVLVVAVAVFMARARNIRMHTVAEIAAPVETLHGELGRFVAVLNSVNSESDADYVASLARLRTDKDNALAEATRLLAESPQELFTLRHSVVLAVSAMRAPQALDLLSKVALNPQPLPPGEPHQREISAESLDVEDIVQGTMIALDAVDGIEMLAADGYAAALDTLVAIVQVDSNAIRGAALTALAARGEWQRHFQQALHALPVALRPLAELRRVNVHDVPQVVDPRVHLAGKKQRIIAAPPLPEDAGKQKSPPVLVVHNAPKIHRR